MSLYVPTRCSQATLLFYCSTAQSCLLQRWTFENYLTIYELFKSICSAAVLTLTTRSDRVQTYCSHSRAHDVRFIRVEMTLTITQRAASSAELEKISSIYGADRMKCKVNHLQLFSCNRPGRSPVPGGIGSVHSPPWHWPAAGTCSALPHPRCYPLPSECDPHRSSLIATAAGNSFHSPEYRRSFNLQHLDRISLGQQVSNWQ